MIDSSEGLNTRFNIALQSGSDREFWENLYRYFDFIHKTPELKAIFDRSEREYTAKHAELWRKRPMTDAEADHADAETIKLERFNLFAVGTLIYMRIYLPIDDYRNSDDPDEKQDPVAVILLRGGQYVLGLKRWSKDQVNLLNRWFEGKRSLYESTLRRFHIMFLDELAKPRDEVKNKPEIKFDEEASVLSIGDKVVKIKLKNDKPNDHFVLEYIFENKEGLGAKSYYSDIIESKFPQEKVNERSLRRACEAINKKVGVQAGIGNFLKFESGKSGSVQINPDYL